MLDRTTFLTELNALEARFAALEPELEVTVRDPLLGVEGYVVVWNTGISAGGPLEFSGKGGTRVTPTVSLDEVRMLARIMALKNAAAGLPMGGAKSGLKANAGAPDIEEKYRRFVKLCAPNLHCNGGVFGGFGFDIGGRPEMALWAVDELGTDRCFTGKPVDKGGTDYDREGIAGLGVATAARTLLEEMDHNPVGATYAVQGAGAMGAAVVRYFTEYGGQLTAIADPRLGGGWRLNDAPSRKLLMALTGMEFEVAKGLLAQEAVELPLDGVLYEAVDVLFPCAVQEVITANNVAHIQAKAVVEGANNPVTAEARDVLYGRHIALVPDFIANAGGIIAAYVELTHPATPEENAQTRVKVKEAKKTAEERIDANVRQMHHLVVEHQVSPAQAGRYMALKNIFGA